MNNELIARLRLRDDNEHQTADLDALAAANALSAAEAQAVEAERLSEERRVLWREALHGCVRAERQLAEAREVLKLFACRCRKTCLDGVHDCWRRKARAALSDAPAPVGGEACAIIRGFMACVELDIDAQDKDPETLALETRALRFLSDAPAPVSGEARAESAEALLHAVQQNRDHYIKRAETAERQLAAAREALKWTKQVYPEPLPHGGVYVEMTKEEFEAMRAALSDAPAPVSEP